MTDLLHRLRDVLRHSLVQNALSLYGVYVVNYLLPIVTVPYLARVLGPASWGLLAMSQALGAYLMLAVEYGFSLSATREVARLRNDRDRLAQLLIGVAGAQVMLAVLLAPIPVVVRLWVPILRDQSPFIWAAYLWAVVQGANLAWFFQGLERMRTVAALDVSVKLLNTAGIFLLIRAPHDAVVVLLLQAGTSAASLAAGWILTLREVPLVRPSMRESFSALKLGWSLFVFRGAVSMYTVGNAFILGLFASPQVVGYYSAAERIIRAVVGLLGPVSQTLYPRLSHLVRSAWDEAVLLAGIGIRLMSAGGLVLGTVVFLGAPLLVHLLFGPRFAPAVPALRILAALAPLIAVSNVLGIQWMLPLGLDRVFNTIIIGAGLLNIGAASWLAPRLGHVGMSWAIVITEAFVTAAMFLYLRVRHLEPGRRTIVLPGEVV